MPNSSYFCLPVSFPDFFGDTGLRCQECQVHSKRSKAADTCLKKKFFDVIIVDEGYFSLDCPYVLTLWELLLKTGVLQNEG